MINFTKKNTLRHFSRTLFKSFGGPVLQNTSLYICSKQAVDGLLKIIQIYVNIIKSCQFPNHVFLGYDTGNVLCYGNGLFLKTLHRLSSGVQTFYYLTKNQSKAIFMGNNSKWEFSQVEFCRGNLTEPFVSSLKQEHAYISPHFLYFHIFIVN